MKRFKDIYVNGDTEKLKSLINATIQNLPNKWSHDTQAEEKLLSLGVSANEAHYAFSREADKNLPAVGLYLIICNDTLTVPNIVPKNTGQLSFEQYNELLDEFSYIICAQNIENFRVNMKITSDEENIKDWLSQEAVDALKTFSILANKSTGSSHPLDFHRWVAFIIYAHDENSALDGGTLQRFLVEEYDWPEEQADKLASQYDFGRGLLRIRGKN